MPAYIYGNVEITDPALYEEYRRDVPALIAAHGGRYLVRGGAVSVLEGSGVPHRQVILEFAEGVGLHLRRRVVSILASPAAVH